MRLTLEQRIARLEKLLMNKRGSCKNEMRVLVHDYDGNFSGEVVGRGAVADMLDRWGDMIDNDPGVIQEQIDDELLYEDDNAIVVRSDDDPDIYTLLTDNDDWEEISDESRTRRGSKLSFERKRINRY